MKSHDFCEATLHALSSQLCVIDSHGVIIFVNSAWQRFADENPPAPVHYALKANYLDVCDRATGENAREARPFADGIRSVLSGTATLFEMAYPCHAPGVIRWFRGRVNAMEMHGAIGAVISHTDITVHHFAEEALRTTERRYRTLFELSGTGMVILGRNGVYQMVNRKAAEVLGSPPDIIVGKSLFDFFAADIAHVSLEQNQEVIDTGRAREYETRFQIKGQERTFLVSDQPIDDDSGRGIALQSSYIEITDRMRLQEELRALAGHLQSGREEERRYIAREIHDHFGQVLSALKIDLTLMMKDLLRCLRTPIQGTGCQKQLSLFDETLESIILDLRLLVSHLRPEMLESLGIVRTMEYEVKEFERSTGILARFDSGQYDPRLDIDTSMALYRIVQEALSNIRRHAHATRVTVRFERTDGSLILQIEDDGQGFRRSPTPEP